MAEADAQAALKINSKDFEALYLLSDIAEKRGKNAEGDLFLKIIPLGNNKNTKNV